VELKLLAPKEVDHEIFSVEVPVRETEPPYNFAEKDPATFTNKFDRVEAVVGVLPPGATLDKKLEQRSPRDFNGAEPVNLPDGRMSRIFDAQNLVVSNVLSIQ
jgi:hypothetical protein